MIELFDAKSTCCGCTACVHTCPTGAISMEADEEGFFYPRIDSAKCNECGLCKEVCAFQNTGLIQKASRPMSVVAMKHQDEKTRLASRSGGFAYAAGKMIISEQGVVCGAVLGSDLTVSHELCDSDGYLKKQQGAKYVQSRLGDIFPAVRDALLKGVKVLFSGTPCQIAGLKAYLGRMDTSNLWLLDLVCHGTPSPVIFREYIEYYETQYRGKITDFDFRDKSFGWHSHMESFVINQRKICKSVFVRLFYSHCMLRPSCHRCPYSNLQRVSDITLGDFWGVERCMPDFDDDKGVSLLLINTAKGEALLNEIRADTIIRQVLNDDFMQPQLMHPPVASSLREKFWDDHKKSGFGYLAKNYGGDSFSYRIKAFAGNVLRRIGLLAGVKKLLGRK